MVSCGDTTEHDSEYGCYEPGTILSRDEEPYCFRGPDGKRYRGRVAMTELNPRDFTFVARVPARRRFPLWQKIYLEALRRIGIVRRMRHGGETFYTSPGDAAFMKGVFGDAVEID